MGGHWDPIREELNLLMTHDVQAAVDAAVAAALARKAEAETREAVAAALAAAGLSEWAEPNDPQPEPDADWSRVVTLTAIDTSNVWRTSRREVINSWMDPDRMEGWHLWVRFIAEDDQPEVVFVPFRTQGSELGGMRPGDHRGYLGSDGHAWKSMVAQVNRDNRKRFKVQYRYVPIEE